MKKIINFFFTGTMGEITRFLIIGGLATIIDFFVMSLVLFFLNNSLYSGQLLNVFIGSGNPTTFSVVLATMLGFLCGLIFNYIFSILFVFTNTKRAKNVKGMIMFASLAFIGLLIHTIGMYVFYDVLGVNEWVIKIVLTIIVLIFNYISRKTIIFKDDNKTANTKEMSLTNGK